MSATDSIAYLQLSMHLRGGDLDRFQPFNHNMLAVKAGSSSSRLTYEPGEADESNRF